MHDRAFRGDPARVRCARPEWSRPRASQWRTLSCRRTGRPQPLPLPPSPIPPLVTYISKERRRPVARAPDGGDAKRLGVLRLDADGAGGGGAQGAECGGVHP